VSKQKILVAVIGNGNFEKIGKCLLKSHPSAKMLDLHWVRIYEPLKPTEDNLHLSLTQVKITKISAFTFKKISLDMAGMYS
jgi:hypothetical protein